MITTSRNGALRLDELDVVVEWRVQLSARQVEAREAAPGRVRIAAQFIAEGWVRLTGEGLGGAPKIGAGFANGVVFDRKEVHYQPSWSIFVGGYEGIKYVLSKPGWLWDASPPVLVNRLAFFPFSLPPAVIPPDGNPHAVTSYDDEPSILVPTRDNLLYLGKVAGETRFAIFFCLIVEGDSPFPVFHRYWSVNWALELNGADAESIGWNATGLPLIFAVPETSAEAALAQLDPWRVASDDTLTTLGEFHVFNVGP